MARITQFKAGEEYTDILQTEAGIPFEYNIDFEEDTGYIHHIYDCLY